MSIEERKKHFKDKKYKKYAIVCFGVGVGWVKAERAEKLWKTRKDGGEEENSWPFARRR